jgi:flagellar hook-basal body complex protein FliE
MSIPGIGGIGGIGAGMPGLGGVSALALDDGSSAGAAAAGAGSGGGFGKLLDGLTNSASTADSAVKDLAVGGNADLHDVTLSVQMESLSFDLAVQIRNRLVDAYQEMFRMQV